MDPGDLALYNWIFINTFDTTSFMDLLDKELAQLVSDPSFRRYVLRQDESAKQYWENWLDAHPEKAPLLERAKGIVQMWESSRQEVSPAEIATRWQQLERQIFAVGDSPQPLPATKSRFIRFWPLTFIAAACALLLSLWVWPGVLLQPSFEKHTVVTGYGEKREVELPDGSQITLNANSELNYYSPWDSLHPREVWLSGEGFFDVEHHPKIGASRFQVHLGELVVEVLGTSFNASSRRNRTQVVLQEGKVQLTRSAHADTLYMKPGELVEYGDNELFIKRKVDPEAFSSWTQNRIIFSESSLRSIGEMIIDRYGMNVEIVGSEAFARRTFSGEAVVEDIEDFILLLESLGIDVQREESRILIRESTR